MAETKKGDSHGAVTLRFQSPDGHSLGMEHSVKQDSFTTTRTALHRGHKIKVDTTYRIEIDDKPVTLHTMVLDDGRVHYHGLPNYSFPSAVDLARSIIDAVEFSSIDVQEVRAGSGQDQQDPHQDRSGNKRGEEDD